MGRKTMVEIETVIDGVFVTGVGIVVAGLYHILGLGLALVWIGLWVILYAFGLWLEHEEGN
jgi:hypothetical protein